MNIQTIKMFFDNYGRERIGINVIKYSLNCQVAGDELEKRL